VTARKLGPGVQRIRTRAGTFTLYAFNDRLVVVAPNGERVVRNLSRHVVEHVRRTTAASGVPELLEDPSIAAQVAEALR
jgi:hypothetical protein